MIKIEVEGVRELVDKLKTLAKYTSEGIAETLNKSANDVIYPIFAQKFEDEGATQYSPRWVELSKITQNAREYRIQVNKEGHYILPSSEQPAHKILHWTYRLRSSILGESTESIFDIKHETNKHTMILGTSVSYADLLHSGGISEQGWEVPARPIYEPEDFKNELIDYIREHIRAIL